MFLFLRHSFLFQIRPLRFLFIGRDLDSLFLFLVFAFHFLFLLFFVKWSCGLITSVGGFFRDFWNVLDIFIIILGFVCIAIYNYRDQYAQTLIEEIKIAKHNEFVDYEQLFNIEDVLEAVASTLMVLLIVKLIKLVRGGFLFEYIKMSMRYVFSASLVILIFHIFSFFLFACAAFLYYGSDVQCFSSVWASFSMVFVLSYGLYTQFDYDLFATTWFGTLFFMSLTVVSLCFTIFYLIVLLYGVRYARNFLSNRRYLYSWYDFLKEETLYFWDMLMVKTKKERLRAGGGEKYDVIYPKADRERYRSVIACSKNRMEAMRSIARSVIRRHIRYANPNYVIMKKLLLAK